MTDLAQLLATWDTSQAPAATGRPAIAAAALAAEAPRLRRLVHRLLGWPAQASEVDDVVQETLLAAWAHRETFRGDAQWTTWLHRIALRKAHNHVRSSAVRRRLFGWLVAETPEPAARAEEHGADERLSATHAALQTLAHGDREVLVLRYLEQRPIEQIAALLRCSRAAVDARLSRARSRLRAALHLPEAP